MAHVNPTDLLTWIALAVALVIGARGGIQRNTIAALKEQNDAYAKRETQHQLDLDRLRAERAKKDEQTDAALKRLGARNEVLEELVLRRAETTEIIDVLRDHDREAATRHAGTIKTLRDIVRAQKERTEVEQHLLDTLLEVTGNGNGGDDDAHGGTVG